MSLPPTPARVWISATLRWGSWVSAGVMLIGVVWLLADPAVPRQVGPPMPLGQLADQLRLHNPYAVMQAGVLLLLLTPVLRLVVAAVSFWVEQERRYALVSLAVLAIIALSLWLARLGG